MSLIQFLRLPRPRKKATYIYIYRDKGLNGWPEVAGRWPIGANNTVSFDIEGSNGIAKDTIITADIAENWQSEVAQKTP